MRKFKDCPERTIYAQRHRSGTELTRRQIAAVSDPNSNNMLDP